MTKLNGDSLEFAMLYLFLALIHHARQENRAAHLAHDASLDDLLGFLFRSLWSDP
jgi:hypothetical protein